MKKLFFLTAITLVLISCDPVSTMDANIRNATSQKLSITFVSSSTEIESKTLQMDANETVLFQEFSSIGGDFLEPYLVEYDSIYIQNEANKVLKIFKQNSTGKNIYNIEDEWMFREKSKRVYKYDYEINDEDLN